MIPGGLLTQLTRGNNGFGFDPPTGPLPGATRFTNVLANRFIARYDIVDHHASDATGFSATLLKDTTTNTYTLSFRSLEYQNQVDGGDWERDGLPGAAGEIAGTGFALAQLVSMERYYRELKESGNFAWGDAERDRLFLGRASRDRLHATPRQRAYCYLYV